LLLYYKQMSEKGISQNSELKYRISNRNRNRSAPTEHPLSL